jgi:hypothetical protein
MGTGPRRDDAGAVVDVWPTGDELLVAAGNVEKADDEEAQRTAFAVAVGVRDDDPQGIPALTALLTGAARRAALGEGTLVNTLTAVQYASMQMSDAAIAWVPPRPELTRLVLLALDGRELLREQAEELLWAFVDRRLVGRWLGDRAAEITAAVRDPGLREALARRGA